jgi:hypothetical protein
MNVERVQIENVILILTIIVIVCPILTAKAFMTDASDASVFGRSHRSVAQISLLRFVCCLSTDIFLA